MSQASVEKFVVCLSLETAVYWLNYRINFAFAFRTLFSIKRKMNRAIQLLIKSAKVIKPATRTISTTSARNSGAWAYRSSGSHYLSKKHFMAAELIGAVMWYWILIHLWHEPEHITGDFPYPDPKKWTNAELGIPDE